jgi:hypothetical protein
MPGPGSARLVACAALCVVALVGDARAEDPVIYKWVDSNGVAHYTTDKKRIPSAIRDRIERSEPAAAPPPAASQPAVVSPPVAPAQSAAQPPNSASPAAAPVANVPAAAAPPVVAQPAPAPQPAAPAPAPAAARAERAVPAQPLPAGTASAPPRAQPPAAAPAAAAVVPAAAAAPTAAVSNLARDAIPATAPAAEAATTVSSPPPFRSEPAEATTPDLSKPADPNGPVPLRQIPSSPATIESDGVAPEPTGEKTRTATAEIGPRKPVDAAELADLDKQIAVLQDKIAKDEDALTALISVPEAQRKGPLVDDPKFREIAKRLPKLQADLQSLRERRGQVQLAPTQSP